jgi:exodeoxyribonuclease X
LEIRCASRNRPDSPSLSTIYFYRRLSAPAQDFAHPDPLGHPFGEELQALFIALGVDLPQGAVEPQHEKSHGVGALGDRRIALLDFERGALRNTQLFRHHLPRQAALLIGPKPQIRQLQPLSRNVLSDPPAQSIVRVIDLETAGNGPHEVCEIGWQDVERGGDGTWQVTHQRGSAFVNPGRPITPETMAVHHILDKQVAGAPFWKTVAPDILRPASGVLALAAHRAAFEQRYCRPSLTGAVDWICTWKSALRVWPDLPSFSNQRLRYQRRPEGLVHELGLPAHRALPDAYVTAHHLRDLLNAASLEQLIAWSREPGLLPRAPAGPERGKLWRDVPLEALQAYAKERDPDVRFSAGHELSRRGQAEPTAPAQMGQGALF